MLSFKDILLKKKPTSIVPVEEDNASFPEDLQAELFVAVQTENIEKINSLIQKGADVNKTIGWMQELDNSHYHTSFLHIAIEKLTGFGSQFKIYTFKQINEDTFTTYSGISSFKNRFEVIQCLIQNGANTNYIITSFYHGYATLLQRVLLNLSSSYDGRENKNFDLNFRVFKLLLENGANPNQTGLHGWRTPLHELFRIFNQNTNKVNEQCFKAKVNIVHLLLLYGSEMPIYSKKLLKKQTLRLYKYVEDWPCLPLFYCLSKKKIFFCFLKNENFK